MGNCLTSAASSSFDSTRSRLVSLPPSLRLMRLPSPPMCGASSAAAQLLEDLTVSRRCRSSSAYYPAMAAARLSFSTCWRTFSLACKRSGLKFGKVLA
jgi:hypothetical protein